MKNFDIVTTRIKRFQEHVQKTWRMFLFMPARYWKGALIVFGAILLIILFVDAWLFWRFVQAPLYVSNETASKSFILKRGELESSLRFLRKRETNLLQKNETIPLREIFGVPPTPAPTQ